MKLTNTVPPHQIWELIVWPYQPEKKKHLNQVLVAIHSPAWGCFWEGGPVTTVTH